MIDKLFDIEITRLPEPPPPPIVFPYFLIGYVHKHWKIYPELYVTSEEAKIVADKMIVGGIIRYVTICKIPEIK